MEHRRELRFETNQKLVVRTLGPSGDLIQGHSVNYSGRGMRLTLERPVEPDSLVRIQIGPQSLLARVAYCTPNAGPLFDVGVSLVHSLRYGEIERYAALLDDDRKV